MSGDRTGEGRFLTKVGKTLRHYGARVLWAGRDVWCRVAGISSGRPVFVMGCSRAGTTLVYKTLSEAAELGSLQAETHDFWDGLHPLAARGWSSHVLGAADAGRSEAAEVFRHFYRRTGKQRFVDKNNQNGLCVEYLRALFPDAIFVYVKRSPGDNINSLMEGWRRPDQFATWSADLPAQVAVDGGQYQRWCFFLPPGWRDYLEAPLEEVCAYQYRSMNEAILNAQDLSHEDTWVDVHYEDLVYDPVAGFRQVFNHCGLGFPERIRSHCESVLRRPYNAFSEIRVEKWRTAADSQRIARVLPTVRGVAARMGYREAGG